MQIQRAIDSITNRIPIMRYLVLTVLAVFLFAPAAFAQGGMQQGQPAEAPEVEVTDQELDAIAEAYVEVQEVLVDHRSDLSQAEDAEEARAIQQQMAAEANEVIQDNDVEIQRFDNVIQAANADAELRQRLTQRIEALTNGDE